MDPDRKPKPFEIHQGHRPGALGWITEIHGRYYSEQWGFDQRFEIEVAIELADFLRHYDPARDGLWLALRDGNVVGSIAIDGRGEDGARLRWFIVEPGQQGGGLGRDMLDQAFDFCRRQGFTRICLATFAGLDPARRLYESRGFELIREYDDTDWGPKVTHQVFERLT